MSSRKRTLTRIDQRTVRMRLRSAPAVAAMPDRDVHPCSPGGTRQLRVLVVDDYPDAAASVAMLAEIWGHRTWVARDGPSALKMAAVCQADVLLLDITMPKMDGYQIARQLRRQRCFQSTLLIAITGWTDEAHRELSEKAGFDLHLIKPVEPSTLEVLLALERNRLAGLPAALSGGLLKETYSWEGATETGPWRELE